MPAFWRTRLRHGRWMRAVSGLGRRGVGPASRAGLRPGAARLAAPTNRPSAPAGVTLLLLERQQPDVAELHRVAVVLKQDRPRRTRVAAHPRPGVVHRDLDVVVDLDAVLMDGYPGRDRKSTRLNSSH